MTTDPQKIKARLNDVAADVRDVYQDAVCCINELQEENRELQVERDEFEAIGNRSLEKVRELDTENAALKAKLARDFPCCDAPDEQQEPERLTVADLENAPVGSELGTGESWADKDTRATKRMDGRWVNVLMPNAKGVTSEAMIKSGNGWDTATLTHPAPAPVTAETIRQSEVGSTWTYPGTKFDFEWTGEMLKMHTTSGSLGFDDYLRYVDLDHDWYRSTTAPRGDYGKAEVPTEPGEVILVTEFGGLYDVAEPIAAYRTNGNTWRRLDQEPWPGDYLGLYAPDEEITGWKPAKVVTDE